MSTCETLERRARALLAFRAEPGCAVKTRVVHHAFTGVDCLVAARQMHYAHDPAIMRLLRDWCLLADLQLRGSQCGSAVQRSASAILPCPSTAPHLCPSWDETARSYWPIIVEGKLQEEDMVPEGGLMASAHGQACELRSGGTGSMARPPDTSPPAGRRSSSPHQCAATGRNSCPAIAAEFCDIQPCLHSDAAVQWGG